MRGCICMAFTQKRKMARRRREDGHYDNVMTCLDVLAFLSNFALAIILFVYVMPFGAASLIGTLLFYVAVTAADKDFKNLFAVFVLRLIMIGAMIFLCVYHETAYIAVYVLASITMACMLLVMIRVMWVWMRVTAAEARAKARAKALAEEQEQVRVEVDDDDGVV